MPTTEPSTHGPPTPAARSPATTSPTPARPTASPTAPSRPTRSPSNRPATTATNIGCSDATIAAVPAGTPWATASTSGARQPTWFSSPSTACRPSARRDIRTPAATQTSSTTGPATAYRQASRSRPEASRVPSSAPTKPALQKTTWARPAATAEREVSTRRGNHTGRYTFSVPTRPTLTPAAARLRDAASELFYSRGIGAVGVDLVAERAGTTKKTLYDRFGSKEGLVVAYLEHRCELWQAFVADRLAAATTTGADRVLEPLLALAAWMETADRGCGFVNAYAELAGTGHAGLEVIAAEKQWTVALYSRLAAEAGLSDPERVGARLAIVHDGAIVQATSGRRPVALPEALDLARVVLAA